MARVTPKTFIRLTTTLVLLGLCAMACVRLIDEPSFTCKSDSDCEQDQKCVNIRCLPRDYCVGSSYCPAGQHCSASKCVPNECNVRNDPACGNYACSEFSFTCSTDCIGDQGCRSPARCVRLSSGAGTCQSVTTLPIDATCTVHADCATGACCQGLDRSACAASCDESACEHHADCIIGYCCTDPTGSTRNKCQLKPCSEPDGGSLGSPGAPCDGGAQCASGECVGAECAPSAGALGASCESNSECDSGRCCASRDSPEVVCSTECTVLTGDYCTADLFTAFECEGTNDYCDGLSNFPDDGYCSRSCTGGCGHNSSGRPNVCIALTQGSSPASACKPGCDTLADCQAIHPDLRCFGATKKACDFDTATWAGIE